MKRLRLFTSASALLAGFALFAQTFTTESVISDWQFRRDHDWTASSGWKQVRVPHDWAISGPFDRANDLQEVAVKENGESKTSVKTGRTGGLPWVGKGCYKTILNVPDSDAGRRLFLLFDGAMSEAKVLVNGNEAGQWAYGYNAFFVELTGLAFPGPNEIAVLLENKPRSSRWYPGAGLYRKVRYISKPTVCIPIWGTQILTPKVSADEATVVVKTEVEGLTPEDVISIETVIKDAGGKEVARRKDVRRLYLGEPVTQTLRVPKPRLWSPDTPDLYYAETSVYSGGSMNLKPRDKSGKGAVLITEATQPCDRAVTRFGIRSIEVREGEGFFLNGEKTQFKGVCLHHDLGPLGAAMNRAAQKHHLLMLKDMGCNAVRTSHNMPADELVELCDELGLMLMVEAFDEWGDAKCENGYHRFFEEWAEDDLVNMLCHFRNNPSVVMWSIGNEVPSQRMKEGYLTARYLQDICHREDPSRPVTIGMNQFDNVMANGFVVVPDVPGFNYKPDRYESAYPLLPQGVILCTESASTVSSRGTYHFPVQQGGHIHHPDHQSSSYDVEYCNWSNIPDADFAADEDYPWMMGQFVWTGFDYLGESTPYDVDAWPNHSSVFGIIDLASIPKDRYYLYRSVWNTQSPTLHILPHWTWPDRKGQVTPVYVYTSYPAAELFVNGKSQGRREKHVSDDVKTRYRLMWDDVVYQPGELKVVAYDKNGAVAAEKTIRTAGEAAAVKCSVDRKTISADGEDLAYVTVSLVDAAGTLVPSERRVTWMKISGPGVIEAVANGDPTCLEPFKNTRIHPFGGQFSFIVRSTKTPGTIVVEVAAERLRKEKVIITTK